MYSQVNVHDTKKVNQIFGVFFKIFDRASARETVSD